MSQHPFALAALLADLLMALHLGVVLFVVGGQLAIVAGAWRGWHWVRARGWRSLHLVTVAFVALNAWLGELCPLTIWEQALRRSAGQDGYGGSFIAYWLSRLLYWELPWWVFVLAYTLFAGLVVGSWFWVRPHGKA
jgi:hypothetical protein